VLDLWTTKVENGLQLLVDASTKKHTASSTVPPTEGLVAAVNLALIHALFSSSTNISPGVNKILSAGSASKIGVQELNPLSISSFKALTDAVVTTGVIGQPLPRTIALYTKLVAKKEEGSSVPLIATNQI
jgi:hypothetical protein